MQFQPQFKSPELENQDNIRLFVPNNWQTEKRFNVSKDGGFVRRIEDREAYNPQVDLELQNFRNMIFRHNWYYDYSKSLENFNAGWRNEQAILEIVNRKGGVFKTIWEAEKNRHRPQR